MSVEDDFVKDLLQNAIITTLQTTMSVLGPMPDKCGDRFKEIVKEASLAKVIQVVGFLEECQIERTWKPLIEGLKKIPRMEEVEK